MSKVPLSLAYGRNVRNSAVLDGVAKAQGVDFCVSEVHAAELFWRQFERAEFDVSELSISSLLISIDHGNAEYIGIPAFSSRTFFHTRMLVRSDSGIETPADLVGKRIGIPEYQQTGALWVRQALQEEFGVAPDQMEWWMGRSKNFSHGGSTDFRVPNGVTMHYVAQDDDLGSMIVRGELDALGMYVRNTLVDRSTIDLDSDARVRTLFPDPIAEGIRYYRKTGIYPINHTLAIRRSLVEKYPWLPQNLYNAFVESKRIGEAKLRNDTFDYVAAGCMSVSGEDPMPYGYVANRRLLDTLRRCSFEQGLTSRLIDPEEVWVPSMLTL